MYVGGTESQSTKLSYAKRQLYFLYMTWLSFSNFPFPLLAETWIWHFWVKINQVRVFVTLILRVAVKFQAQRKGKDCVVLSIRAWKWPSSSSHQSARTFTEASWITLVTDRRLSPTAVCRAPHSLHGPWPDTLSNAIATSARLHSPHSNERLPHILGPPSVLPLALSASMWERSRSSPLPIQTVRSLIALSDPACLDSAVSISILLLLPHNEGCWVLFDLLSFLIPQYEGQVLPDLGSHILSHLCPSPGKAPNATFSPLYSLLLCQHLQCTGEISKAQRG